MIRFRYAFLRSEVVVQWLAVLGIVLGAVAVEAQQTRQAPGAKTKPSQTEAKPKQPDKEGWISLFDGKTLGEWKVVTEADFERHGKVHVEDRRIILEDGIPATGIKWAGKFPKIDYEIALEAMRMEGEDFFCGLTFPVGDKWLTLVCGGWGGQVTGLSNIDGDSAVDNETCTIQEYKQKQWYSIRVRVAKDRIGAWLDKEQIVDLEWANRQLSIRWEVEPTQPLGIATWYTTAALRNIRFRPLGKKPVESTKDAAAQHE